MHTLSLCAKATDSRISSNNIDRCVQLAKLDPTFPKEVLQQWAEKLEGHIAEDQTKYDYAKLFGSLLNEWLEAGSTGTAPATSPLAKASETTGPSSSQAVGTREEPQQLTREEALQQKTELESIIFNPISVDLIELRHYLMTKNSSETNGLQTMLKICKTVMSMKVQS